LCKKTTLSVAPAAIRIDKKMGLGWLKGKKPVITVSEIRVNDDISE